MDDRRHHGTTPLHYNEKRESCRWMVKFVFLMATQFLCQTRACVVKCGATLMINAHCAEGSMEEIWCVMSHIVQRLIRYVLLSDSWRVKLCSMIRNVLLSELARQTLYVLSIPKDAPTLL